MIRPSNNKIKILLHGEPYHTKMFEDQLKANSKGIFEPKYFEILMIILIIMILIYFI